MHDSGVLPDFYSFVDCSRIRCVGIRQVVVVWCVRCTQVRLCVP